MADFSVVIVDDHPIVLESLSRVVGSQGDFDVVATAPSMAEGLRVVREHLPYAVIVDFALSDGDGATLARMITQQWPGTAVVMLTGSDDDTAVFAAAQSGCMGYVSKAAPPVELLRVLRSVCRGGLELPAGLLARLPHVEELAVQYQPIVRLADGHIEGFEALVRWQHPDRGFLPPSDFIGLAEKTPYIIRIDDHVRDEACRAAAAWNASLGKGDERFASVNLSAVEVSRDLTESVVVSLESSGLQPSNLMVEITEKVLPVDDSANLAVLKDLKDMGVRLALDDFGTGHSSLGYLRHFPIDVIKLDKSFIDDLPDGGRGRRLVEAVRRLSAELGAVSEAEGVETGSQVDYLGSIGWQLAQGYYFASPMGSSAVAKALSAPGLGPGVGARG